jgi:hypothetical protein
MYETARENLEVSGALDDPHAALVACTKFIQSHCRNTLMRKGKELAIELDITTRRSSSLDVGTAFAAFAFSTCPASRPRFGFEALVPRACAYATR